MSFDLTPKQKKKVKKKLQAMHGGKPMEWKHGDLFFKGTHESVPEVLELLRANYGDQERTPGSQRKGIFFSQLPVAKNYGTNCPACGHKHNTLEQVKTIDEGDRYVLKCK